MLIQRGKGGGEPQGQGAARTQPVPLPCGGPWMRSSHGLTWAQRKVAGPDPSWHPLGWPISGSRGEQERETGREPQREDLMVPWVLPGVPCTGAWGHTMANIEGQRPSRPRATAWLVQEPFALLLLPTATDGRTRFLRGTGKSSWCPPLHSKPPEVQPVAGGGR